MVLRLPHAARQRGFTLIELLIVLVILGLLAALVGPRLFGNVDKAKAETTRSQITQLSTGLDQFRLDVGRYPSTEETLAALVTKPDESTPGAARWHGPYLPKLPKDGWNNAYQYKAPGDHGDYDLWSYGADNKEGGEDYNADITNWQGNPSADASPAAGTGNGSNSIPPAK